MRLTREQAEDELRRLGVERLAALAEGIGPNLAGAAILDALREGTMYLPGLADECGTTVERVAILVAKLYKAGAVEVATEGLIGLTAMGLGTIETLFDAMAADENGLQ